MGFRGVPVRLVGGRALTGDPGRGSAGLPPRGAVGGGERLGGPGGGGVVAGGGADGRARVSPMGQHQARAAADNILGREAQATADLSGSPRVVFTDPQVAAVGLTLAGAEEKGLNVRAVDHPTEATAGGSFHGRNAPGTSRLVIDEDRS